MTNKQLEKETETMIRERPASFYRMIIELVDEGLLPVSYRVAAEHDLEKLGETL